MSHFFCLRETAELAAFIAEAAPLPAESVSIAAALGRVLAEDNCAPLPCPADNRSTRDGYAVRAADVAVASPLKPAKLRLAGECRMGEACGGNLHAGEAWRVYTGGPLPNGADAVVMQEHTVQCCPQSDAQREDSLQTNTPPPFDEQTLVAVSRPCAAGQHVLARGADVPQGALLAKAGTKLGAHQLALLAQFFQHVPVHRQPVLGILATGDEFCAPLSATSLAARQTSTNALLLEALAATLGARCLHLGTVPDNIDALKRYLITALPDGPSPCDVIVVIGGSSGGKRDFTAQAIAGLPCCHIFGHDQRVSSGRPLTLARVGQTSIWGLPGHSLSLALAAQVFLAPLLRRLGGQQTAQQFTGSQPTVLARLGLALPVEGTAPTHYPVMLRPENGRLTAWPVDAGTGKTAVLRDMHGWITMPGSAAANRGGLRRGAALRVRLFA
ncbi:molybdopterin molybdotransferase MoeA [Desulfovibrio sp.]|uniref:molybdopterin molybdotransferase MoeA n=1 Tax=Desulfovibrio sp. TaxID=885 RepID=UPI0035B4EEAF